MPKKAKIEKTATGKILKVVNPNAAGIDIASSEMQVCVPEDRDSECNRTFGCFTQDLKQIADWLKSCRIEILRISKKTLQVYRDKGILPYSRIKHKIFFKTEDVHKLLESNYYHLKREL